MTKTVSSFSLSTEMNRQLDMSEKAALGERKPVILLLAAGQSTRMRGTDKLLRLVDGVPQLRRIALAAIATGCTVLVTLPPGKTDRRESLAGLSVSFVEVADFAEGMSASLRAGAALADGRPMMVVPADMPELTAEDLARLCQAHNQAPDALLRAESAGQQGHPVLFPADLVPAFASLTKDRGARDLVSANRERLVLVPLAAHHATLDLDTPEEWAAWESARSADSLARKHT